MSAEPEIKLLGAGDESILDNIAPEVFDYAIKVDMTREFLEDPRHHLVVAIDDGQVVGMATGIDYVHPDKQPEMWINEVGVASTHRRRGIARLIIEKLLSVGRDLGCKEAWVLTDRNNGAAMRLYATTGGEEAPDDQVMFTYHL